MNFLQQLLGGILANKVPPSNAPIATPAIHPTFQFAPNIARPGAESFHFLGGVRPVNNDVINPRALQVYSGPHGNYWQEDTAGNKYPYTPLHNLFPAPTSPNIRGGFDTPTLLNSPFSHPVTAAPQHLGGTTPPLMGVKV